MDSALRLHYGAVHIPSTINHAARVARPYSSFRPPSVSLSSKASTHRALSRYSFSSPVICALNRPSIPWPNHDKDNGKKIVRVVVGASVVLACVIGIINCNYTFNARASSTTRSQITVSQFFPLTAKDVLDSFFMVNKLKEGTPMPKSILKKLIPSKKHELPKHALPEKPSMKECDDFLQVAKIINLKACEKAEERLREVLKDIMSKQKPNDMYPQTAYHVEMALVVVLLFQGKFIEASQCQCLVENNAIPSDSRPHFYRAIIYTMMGQEKLDEAKKYWNEFIKTIDKQPFQPSSEPMR